MWGNNFKSVLIYFDVVEISPPCKSSPDRHTSLRNSSTSITHPTIFGIIHPSSRLSLFILRQLCSLARRAMSSSKPTNGSKILSKEPLSTHEAKWTKLTKINWQDPSGKKRVWECAERSTRSKGGIDGLHSLLKELLTS
jgi:hypothetical protein